MPEHLSVLNLSFNRLSQLPKALGGAPVLQQMYLANNQLTDLPDTFSKLPMIDLFLSENLFTTIPKAVLGMTQVGFVWVSTQWLPLREGKGTAHVVCAYCKAGSCSQCMGLTNSHVRHRSVLSLLCFLPLGNTQLSTACCHLQELPLNLSRTTHTCAFCTLPPINNLPPLSSCCCCPTAVQAVHCLLPSARATSRPEQSHDAALPGHLVQPAQGAAHELEYSQKPQCAQHQLQPTAGALNLYCCFVAASYAEG